MAYKITNLAFTRRDPNRRGRTHHSLRNGRVMIGMKNLRDGKSTIISLATYAKFKKVIDRYETLGAIKIVNLNPGQEPAQVPLHAPSPTPPEPVEDKTVVKEVVTDIDGGKEEEDTSAVVIQLQDKAPVKEVVTVKTKAPAKKKEAAPKKAKASEPQKKSWTQKLTGKSKKKKSEGN